jgi:hypothetical protein
MNNGDNKDIVLIYGEPRYFNSFIQQKGILIYPLFKDISLSLRIIRKLFFILNLPKNLWYAGWKYKLRKAKAVLIFSVEYIEVLYYIKSLNPEIRIIFWYWNPVFRSINPGKVPDKLCEKWSFDRNDCKKYDLTYNTTFYPDNIQLPQNKLKYDVVFLGQDKNRRDLINSIKDQLLAADINPYIYIVDDNATHRNYKGVSPQVPYEEYLNLVSKSRAILDVVQEGQNGLTLRPMEALFFKRKLITNDKLINTHDFYHPNNIFIIGMDKIEHLKHFLTIPLEPVSDAILSYYDVSNWLKRFVE